jgi:two-component system NtrC family sensor kinase
MSDAALLIVDDIEDNRFALARRLARQGYLNVTSAVDGREALELLNSKPFDLVLLDIMMPNVNGYEVLAQMKASVTLRHIPVIMISAVDEIDSVIRCIELGAEDYLPKPFNPTLLRARVGACLERKRLHDQVTARTRELSEALEQQTATSEVLRVISSSPGELEPVFQAMLENAVRICGAKFGNLWLREGDAFRIGATHGAPPAYVDYLRSEQVFHTDPKLGLGRLLRTKEVFQLADIAAVPTHGDKLRQATIDLAGARTLVGVPMLKDNEVIGAFVIYRQEVRPFTDKQIELVQNFAAQAVIAIENTRLLNELRQRTDDLSEALEQQTATSEVLRVISSSPGELEPVFEAMLANATRLCEASYGNMWLCEGDAFRTAALHGPVPAAFVEQWRSGTLFRPGPEVPAVRATKTRQPVQVADLRTSRAYLDGDPLAVSGVEVAGIRTLVAVPMLKENEPVGVIVIYRKEVRPFTDKQIELVQNFAAQAVIAIENTRLLSELRESLQQQTATADVLKVISSSPGELEPVFEAMLANATRICAAKFGSLVLFEGNMYRRVALHNAPAAFVEEQAREPVRPLAASPTLSRVAGTKQVIHIDDILAEQPQEAIAKLGGARTVLCVPMLKDDRIVGVISIYRQEVRPFNDKQIELVSNFAAQAVIAIENTRLLNELRQRTDDLSEALEQQTATSEVLQVISSSPGELEPVFRAMLENATRICEAKFGTMLLREEDAFRCVALHNAPRAYIEERRRNPLIHPHPTSGLGRLVATRQVVHIADIRVDQAYLDGAPSAVAIADIAGARTVLLVPMLKDNELVGSITIYRQEVRSFSDKQIELVKNFAAQAVIAIENTRLLSELRQRTDELGRSVEELRGLGEVSQAVNSTLDLETVLSTIVAKAVQLSGTEAGAIYVFDNLQREFHLRATYGMDQELIDALARQHIGLDDPNVALAFAQPEPTQVADLREEAPSELNEITLRAGYRARLVAPLIRGEDVVGILVVRRRAPGHFAKGTVDLIKTFAAQSVLAIQNARLFENVEARTRELAKSLEDLRTAQDRLVQTEKLASLGQLTAGIAHEIKNPLNFVNNFSAISVELIDELRQALARANLDNKLRAQISEIADMLQGNLDKVVQHGKRADSIVKNMLLHSRQGSQEHRPVDINAVVEESLNLAYHGARAERQGFNITMERSFDPTAGEADVFPQEITRVLLNLISNGFYAATKRKEEANGGDYEPTLAAATKNLGDSVEIRIRDNGTGIPSEVKDKMFNPFFTTKPAGEGTGLGLSISHDIIVKQHGGSIEANTQPGVFTEFRIVLPRGAATIAKSGERP